MPIAETTYFLYADLYFAINFCADFFVIFLTGKIMRRKIRLWRILSAAALGAVYAVLCALITSRAYYYIPIAALCMLLMCFIAFGYHSIGKFAAVSGIFVGVSFILGGGMQALYNLWVHSISSGGVLGRITLGIADRFSLKAFVILLLVVAAVALIIGRLAERRKVNKTEPVEVIFFGRTVSFESLIDTGNMLLEPISARPVVIVDEEIAEKLLPGAEGAYDFMRLSSLSEDIARRIRIIPLTTIGGDGVIVALLCDDIKIGGVSKTACVGIYTGNKEFSGYHSIMPVSLV